MVITFEKRHKSVDRDYKSFFFKFNFIGFLNCYVIIKHLIQFSTYSTP